MFITFLILLSRIFLYKEGKNSLSSFLHSVPDQTVLISRSDGQPQAHLQYSVHSKQLKELKYYMTLILTSLPSNSIPYQDYFS